MAAKFQSTPSARRATNCNNFAVASSKISIHALREEGDDGVLLTELVEIEISIHALREEGDLLLLNVSIGQEISIHALREEGDFLGKALHHGGCSISIHALREEGDSAQGPR